jgi:putative oxidoreductase
MMLHGYQKLAAYSSLSSGFPDPFGLGSEPSLILAILAELICSILLILGLFTPLALIPLIVTMIVAIFFVHGNDPWQKKELAAAYLAAYSALLLAGPGRFSLDHKLFK